MKKQCFISYQKSIALQEKLFYKISNSYLAQFYKLTCYVLHVIPIFHNFFMNRFKDENRFFPYQ